MNQPTTAALTLGILLRFLGSFRRPATTKPRGLLRFLAFAALTLGLPAAGQYEGRADVPAVRDASPAAQHKIRIKFHVVKTERFTDAGSEQFIPEPKREAAVQTLVNELNNLYQRAGISFEKVPTVYFAAESALLGIDSSDEKRRLMDFAVSENDALFHLNLIVAPIRNLGLDGHATFPWSRRALRQGSGILLSDEFVFPFKTDAGTPGLLEPQIAAHEVGHALGLWHVERGVDGHEIEGLTPSLKQSLQQSAALASGPDADSRGDFCHDTPPIPNANELELRYAVTDPQSDKNYVVDYFAPQPSFVWPPASVANLMRSSGDRRFISDDQAGRMRAWITHRLRSWLVADQGTPAEGLIAEPTYNEAGNFAPGILLEWQAPSAAAGFHVQRSESAEFTSPVVLTLVRTSLGEAFTHPGRGVSYRRYQAIDFGVQNGKSYWYRIGTSDNESTHIYSPRLDIRGAGARTLNARPGLIPVASQVLSIPGGVLVEWEDPADFEISGYEVRRWKRGLEHIEPIDPPIVSPGTSRYASYFDADPKADAETYSYQILSFFQANGSRIYSGNIDDGAQQGEEHPFSATPRPDRPVLSFTKSKLPDNSFRGSVAVAFRGRTPIPITPGGSLMAVLQKQTDTLTTWTPHGTAVPVATGQPSPRLFTVGSLPTGANYHYRVELVEAIVTQGNQTLQRSHGFSEPMSLRIPGKITTSPAQGVPASGTAGVFPYPVFTWTPVQDAASYDLIIRGPNFNNTTIRLPASLTSYSLNPAAYPELDAFATYFWQVRALNDEGLGPLSGEKSFTTQLRPVNLVAPANGQRIDAPADALTVRPTFSWDGMPGEVSYRLSIRSALGGNEVYSNERDSNSLTVPEASALDSGNYVWDVTSFRRGQASTSQPNAVSATRSFSVRTKPTQAPQQVLPENPASDEPSRPVFVWEKRNQATDYVIEIIRANDTNLRWRFGGETPDNLLGVGVNLVGEDVVGLPAQLKFQFPSTVPGLTGSRKHFWRMRARNEIAGGPWSAPETPESDPENWQTGWWEFTTGIDAGVTDTPANGSVVSDQTPILRALAVSGATNFDFEVRQGSPTNPIYRSGTSVLDSQSWTAEPEMAVGHVYYWRVRATGPPNGETKGAWSAYASFTLRTAPNFAPSNLIPAEGDSQRSVATTFQWTGVGQATSYRIQVRPLGGGVIRDLNVTSSATPLSYQLPTGSTLSPGTDYQWRIAGVNEIGDGIWSVWTGFRTSMTAPVLISPSGVISDQTPELAWNSVIGAGAYEVEVYRSNRTVIVFSGSTTGALRLTTPTLGADTAFEWRVRAIGSLAVEGPWSVWGAFSIRTAPNNPPTPLSPSDGQIDRLTLTSFTWSGAPQATTYEIQVVQNSSGVVLTYTGLTGTAFTLPTADRLAGARVHFWRIRGRNEVGAGPWSATLPDYSDWTEFRTGLDATSPDTPANASVFQDQSPTLQAVSVSGASNYDFEVRQGSTNNPVFRSGSSATNARAWTVSPDLPADAVYYWRTRASGPPNGETKSVWSGYYSFTVRTAPNNAPTPLTPSAGQTDRLTLPNFTWSGAPQSTTYEIEIVQNSSGVVKSFTGLTGTTFTLPVADRLAGDRLHSWRIRGRNEIGAGPWSGTAADRSDWVQFRTGLDKPTNVSPGFGSTGQSRNPLLQWQAVSGAASYDVELWVQEIAGPRLLTGRSGSSTTNSFQIDGGQLIAGQLYHWRVKAVGPTTNSGFNDFWHFFTHP